MDGAKIIRIVKKKDSLSYKVCVDDLCGSIISNTSVSKRQLENLRYDLVQSVKGNIYDSVVHDSGLYLDSTIVNSKLFKRIPVGKRNSWLYHLRMYLDNPHMVFCPPKGIHPNPSEIFTLVEFLEMNLNWSKTKTLSN